MMIYLWVYAKRDQETERYQVCDATTLTRGWHDSHSYDFSFFGHLYSVSPPIPQSLSLSHSDLSLGTPLLIAPTAHQQLN